MNEVQVFLLRLWCDHQQMHFSSWKQDFPTGEGFQQLPSDSICCRAVPGLDYTKYLTENMTEFF